MIYLTGQLLFFLLVTAFLGFIIGWLLRGAMLPVSMLKSKEFIYHSADSGAKNATYQYAKQRNAAPFAEPETSDV